MANKVKNFYKNNKYILVSGGIALFIILLIYFCFDIIPFGDRTVYRMDLYHQYGPLFSEFYDRLTSGESLIYSWNTGLGSSFFGNFFNYLSSPISFIILLFGHKNTFEAVAAMIAIKAVLSAMSMTYYLKKSQKGDGFAISAFGLLYAFSAYFIAYYWNIMWIDALYILPFVALGIEKIIESGKCKTYIIALALAIFSNYYIGYMICIFSCVYFIYYYFCSLSSIKEKKKYLDNSGFLNKIKNSFFLKSGIRFALASVSVGIMLLCVLLPIAHVLKTSSATAGTAPVETKFYFNIYDFLANHLASLEPTIRSSGDDVLPNIYCGILTIFLIPFYFFSKRISSYEKIASAVFIALMYFSFSLNYINFFWHGFHFPNDLPYRQSFIYSFLLIILAYKAFKNIDEFNKKHILGVGIALIAFIVLVQETGSKNVGDITVYISIAFVFLYSIILGLINSKKNQAYALSIMLLCSVTAEAITASTDHYVANQAKGSYVSDYDDFKELQKKIDDNDATLFYRSELSNLRARMDPSWYDYNGVSVFSSMAYEKVANLQKNIGLYGNKINSFTYNPQTPVYNSMFSLKYIYDKSSLISPCDFYSYKDSNGKYSVYENNFALNIAYPVLSELSQWDASSYDNPVEAQEEYFRLSTGVENVFDEIYDYEIINGNILPIDTDSIEAGKLALNKTSTEYAGSATIEITAKERENIYIYVNSRNLNTVSIFSPRITTSMNVNDGYILDLGVHEPGDVISIELPIKDSLDYASVDFTAFTVNGEKFSEGYEKLSKGQLEYDKFNETMIKGTFNAETDEILYTSIPYDDGWKVYIDGKKISSDNIIKISDALIGVIVPEGEHTVTFSYKLPYLQGSIMISCVFTIILLLLYIFKERKLLFFKKTKDSLWKRAKKAQKNAETIQNDSDTVITFETEQDINEEQDDTE